MVAIKTTSGDVTELFSPTRIMQYLGGWGMRKGDASDLMTKDPDDGQPWDMNNPAKRKKTMGEDRLHRAGFDNKEPNVHALQRSATHDDWQT